MGLNMSKICPKCGRLTSDDMNFCPDCGLELGCTDPVDTAEDFIEEEADSACDVIESEAGELQDTIEAAAENAADEMQDAAGEEQDAIEAANDVNETAQPTQEATGEVQETAQPTQEATDDIAAAPEDTSSKNDFLIYQTQPELRPREYGDLNQYANNNGNNGAGVPADNEAAKSAANTSMVLGIVSLVSVLCGLGAIVGVVCGIIGLVFASKSKKTGYRSSNQTAGFICSIIGLCLGILSFIGCICFASLIGLGAMDY